jgi:hypothetical protein
MIEYLTWERLPVQLQMKYNPESITKITIEKNEIKIYCNDEELYIWRHHESQGPGDFSKWIKCS